MQWGNSKGSSNNFTITFPISFATNFLSGSATFTDTYGDRLYCACLSSPTKTTMLLSSGSSNKTIYWTAVGVQQWGAMSPGNSTKYNMQINFPISFTTMPYSIIVHQLQNSGSAGAMGWWYVEALTASSFTMKWQCDCFWITVGKQQWGNKSSAGETTSVTFPISFSSATYMVLGNMSKSTKDGYEVNIYPMHTWSVSSFTMHTRNTTSSEFTWMATGK